MRLRTKLLLLPFVVLVLFFLAGACFGFLLFYRTPGEYFDSNGTRIYYTREGSGVPVILMHGAAANVDLNWRHPGVTRALRRHYDVIAFDLRGHGRSGQPKEPEQYGIQLVEDIVRLMDHLDIRRAHIAGYSLGGFLVLKAAMLYPDRFYSAAVCAAGWKDPEDPSPLPNPYRPPDIAASPAFVTAQVIAFAQPKSLFHRVRSAIGDHLMDQAVKKALKNRYAELAVSQKELERNEVPLLNIIGTRDGFLPLARVLGELGSQVASHEIMGANHFTMPFYREFKQGLLAFFQKNGPSQR